MTKQAEEGSCYCHQWNCGAEEDTDGENGQSLGIEVAVVEVVLLLTQPRFVVLVHLTAHVGEPGAAIGGEQITELKQVER